MISKKKLAEFENIFKLYGVNDFILDIESFKKMFVSDFYVHLLEFINNSILTILVNQKNLFLHINIKNLVISDLYYYDKILECAQILHLYTEKIPSIYIYGCSSICYQIISMLSNSLGYNITNKIIFQSIDDFNIKFVNPKNNFNELN